MSRKNATTHMNAELPRGTEIQFMGIAATAAACWTDSAGGILD